MSEANTLNQPGHLEQPSAEDLKEFERVGALSDKLIFHHLEQGNIVIDPLVRENVKMSSVDVCLGKYYYKERKPFPHESRIYNPYDEVAMRRLWGDLLEGQPASDMLPIEHRTNIDDDELVIVLEPGETILAHTDEFIGSRHLHTTKMYSRSSLGRSFIGVCKCAGWGDPGYFNRWTMEITNFALHHSVILVVFRRIAQMVFIPTGPILGEDYASNAASKYQKSGSLEELKRIWTPDAMLPRLYKELPPSKRSAK